MDFVSNIDTPAESSRNKKIMLAREKRRSRSGASSKHVVCTNGQKSFRARCDDPLHTHIFSKSDSNEPTFKKFRSISSLNRKLSISRSSALGGFASTRIHVPNKKNSPNRESIGKREGLDRKVGPNDCFRSMSHILQLQANLLADLRLKQESRQLFHLGQFIPHHSIYSNRHCLKPLSVPGSSGHSLLSLPIPAPFPSITPEHPHFHISSTRD